MTIKESGDFLKRTQMWRDGWAVGFEEGKKHGRAYERRRQREAIRIKDRGEATRAAERADLAAKGHAIRAVGKEEVPK